MNGLKRVPMNTMEFNQALVQTLTGVPSDNHRQLQHAKKAVAKIIAEDLTDRQRQLIYLRYYKQLNNRQIAAALHIDDTTVCRTLQRARNRIYKSMRIYFEYIHSPADEA